MAKFFLIIKKNIKKQTNKISEARGFINLKLKYPKIKKTIFIIEIKKFVKKSDLHFLKIIWCKWSFPALKSFFLLISLTKLIDKNS